MPTATPFNNLITFSRGSNATVTGSNGLIQWAPNNLLTFSEQFDNAAWTKNNVTITANSTVAPDGTTTADTITATATTAIHNITQAGGSSGVQQTFSVYVKAGTGSFIQLWHGAAANIFANFDTATGVTGTIGAGATATITSAGDGWYRCAITCTPGSTNQFRVAMVTSATAVYGESWTAAGTETCIAWGAQLELGSTATTYNSTTVKNLLGFSEAFSDAAWTETGASIVTGAQANPINGLFNAQKLMEDTSTGDHRTFGAANVTIGTPYVFSAYVKPAGRTLVNLTSVSGALMNVTFDVSTGVVTSTINGVGSIVSVGSGWYRIAVTATATSTASSNFQIRLLNNVPALSYTGDGNSGVYIYGAQLSDSASLDPYVPTPGAAPSSTAFYGPRFDFDPVTLQPRGLLVEEQRTNLLLRSEEFNNASWGKTDVTVTANTTTSPDGTADADSYVEGTAGTASITQNFTGTANATFTGTIYVKRVNTDWVRLTLLETAAATNRITGWFNLSTGAVGSFTNGGTGSGATGSVSDAGNGWYRIRLTGAVNNSATALSLSLTSASADNSTTRVNNAEYRLYGAQLEAGAFATSYIPTVASTVTRSADVATISGQNFAQWFGPATGTLVAEYQAVAGVSMDIAMTSDGTPLTNSLGIYSSNGTSDVGWCRAGGVNQAVISAPSTATTAHKAAFGYEANNFGISAAGSAVVADTAGSIPTINLLRLGGAVSGVSGTNQAFWFRSFRFIPARAADFQLQALST